MPSSFRGLEGRAARRISGAPSGPQGRYGTRGKGVVAHETPKKTRGGNLRCSKKGLSTGAMTKLGSCQVRIEADHPYPHPAVVKTRAVLFRERCARKQEAYFAISGLTQELPGG